MKLSMWILYDYLKQYHPVPSIVNGSCVLRNVRILSDNLAKADSTVYLMDAEKYISGEKNKIICVHQQDMLLLETDDIDEVFNQILDCFEYFNQWSDNCMALIQQGCSMQELFDLSQSMFQEQIFLADSSHVVLNRIKPAITSNFDLSTRQKNELEQCEHVWQNRSLPLDEIVDIRKNHLIYRPSTKAYLGQREGWDNDVLLVNLFHNGILWGWLMEINILFPITIGEMHILETFGTIIEQWLQTDTAMKNDTENFYTLFQTVFQKESDPEIGTTLLQPHLANIGWLPEAHKCLYVVRNQNGDSSVLKNLCYRYNLKAGCITGIADGAMLILTNSDILDISKLESDLYRDLQAANCYAGSSYLFTDISQCAEQKALAELALRYSPKTTGSIHGCSSYILQYLRDIVQKNSQITLTHPVIQQLITYDEENQSDLAKTLYLFLRNERNYQLTAKQLIVHRNTVQYRIEKIIELTNVDLEQADTRLHLLAAFYLADFPLT